MDFLSVASYLVYVLLFFFCCHGNARCPNSRLHSLLHAILASYHVFREHKHGGRKSALDPAESRGRHSLDAIRNALVARASAGRKCPRDRILRLLERRGI